TRDTVTVDIELQGTLVTLIDTAGIEAAQTEVSQQSQMQAKRSTTEAAVRLWCVDASREDFIDAANDLQTVATELQKPQSLDIWVATKTDMGIHQNLDEHWIACSAVTGEGIDRILDVVGQHLSQQDSEEVGSVLGTAARCSQSLQQASDSIHQAILLTRSQEGHEFVSAELRLVAQCLGEVTGAVYTDDILDRVFGRFCIGK
ncbi:MAG: tRNA uridine-5-carboxymethylaminomethyl(34) synthesis GTPase MnmE, partial [Fuerstiella sp.]|nr:tRNA uridine-5-carboxymethylaminomethyl(34) synthesis GTPase MnmE [Fuerstiella sp.]